MAGSGLPFPVIPVELKRTQPAQSPPSHSHLSQVLEQWKIEYARFIIYDTTSEHPSLVHINKHRIRASGGGTWISSGPSASLKIVCQRSSARLSDAVLVVCVGGHVLEEHYITKLHFSWPHVSCLVGFPPRGTKAVLVSFKDGNRQIQKFALRFPNVDEPEKFLNILKELLANASPQPILQVHELSSESSSQVEHMPSDDQVYRPLKDWCSTAPVDYGSKMTLQSSEHVITKASPSKEIDAEKTPATFPLSFTQLMNNCQAEVEAKQKHSAGYLQTEFVKYLGGTSFQALLGSVENVINELGDEFLA